jgi:hypothetical protein
MNLSLASAPSRLESKALQFFQETAGHWRSQRRYYHLNNGLVQEGISFLKIHFLESNCLELQQLAEVHDLDRLECFVGGVKVAWESQDAKTGQHTSSGICVFGLHHDRLYRDRGFSTPQPLIATYHLADPKIFAFRSEYNRSVFEEECRLVDTEYRMRHIVAYKEGEAQMIAQYFETRL